MRRIAFAAPALGAILFVATAAFAANPHFVGTPTCTTAGDQLCCAGKIAGLGSRTTTVEVLSAFSCTNRGGNNPPGLARGISEPITPRNGQITFAVCTDPVRCPSAQMTPTFGPTATINVFQNGNLVFSGTVPVD